MQRISFIDIAKGYGIIAIMAWHVHLAPFVALHYLKFWVLPMFFFLSGVFAKHYSCISDLLLRNIRRLIAPLLLFSVIHIFIFVLLSFFLPDDYSINSLLIRILNPFFATDGPLWFLTALLFIEILHFFFEKLFSNQVLKKVFFALLLSFIAFHIGKITLFEHRLRLPFSIDIACTSYTFYQFGYLLKDYLLKRKKPSLFHLLTIIVSYIAICFLSNDDNGTMAYNKYNCNWSVFIVKSVFGLLSFLMIVYYVIDKLYIFNWLKKIGESSLIFLGLHAVFIPLFSKLIPSHATLFEKSELLIMFVGLISLVVFLYKLFFKKYEERLSEGIIHNNLVKRIFKYFDKFHYV